MNIAPLGSMIIKPRAQENLSAQPQYTNKTWHESHNVTYTSLQNSGNWPEECFSVISIHFPLRAENYLSQYSSGVDPGICVRGTSPFPPLPSPHLLFLLEVGPLKPAKGPGERYKLRQRGPGRSPNRKRIWCTLKLWESHWWKSFWVYRSACFTVERSKFSTG